MTYLNGRKESKKELKPSSEKPRASRSFTPNKKDWGKTWIVAYMWRYRDDEVQCFQPVIERVSPDKRGYPFIQRKILWRGQFICDPTLNELRLLREQLKFFAQKFNITLNRNYRGIIEGGGA